MANANQQENRQAATSTSQTAPANDHSSKSIPPAAIAEQVATQFPLAIRFRD
jgi:hypothetical protein